MADAASADDRRAVAARAAADAAEARAGEPVQREQSELRGAFWRWGRIAFVLISAFVVVQLLHMVQGFVDAVLGVLLFLIFGGIVALILAPFDRLFRRALPNGVSALLSVLIAIAFVGGIGYALSIPTVQQAQELSSSLPRLERPFQDAQSFLSTHGIDVSVGSVASVLGIQVSGANIASTIVHAVSFTVQLAIDVIITLVAAFWLLRDRTTLRRGVLTLMPAKWRVEVQFALDAFVTVFGGYIRGQLVLASLVGALAFTGCLLLGVPFPLIVGFAAGVFELIPLAGPFVGAAVGALFAFTVSPTLALETLGVFIAIHVIEGYFVAPRVQGRFVHLHPLVSLLALLAGVYAGGFLGAFFAVPVASLIAVLLRAGIADLRAEQPELFAMTRRERETVGRRRRILDEYQLGFTGAVRRVFRRALGRPPANSDSG